MENISIKKILDIMKYLIIILLIITFILGFVKINDVKKMTLAKEKELEESYRYNGERISDDVIVPSNVSAFFAEYNGIYSAKDIYTKFSILLKEKIPYYYEICQTSNIEEVYKSNEQDIKYWFGVKDSNELSDFMNYIKNKTNSNKFELESYSFEDGKTSFSPKSTKSDLIIKYKNKENNKVKETKLNVELFEKSDETLIKIGFTK